MARRHLAHRALRWPRAGARRRPAAAPPAAATTAASTPTTPRPWPARRRRSPPCTGRPTSCSPAAATPSKSGSRRCAATRSWSTSGPPGAAPAASSSRPCRSSRPATASGSPSSGSTPGLRRRRARPSSKRRRSPTPATPTPTTEIAELDRGRPSASRHRLLRPRRQLVYLKQGPYADEADLEADLERYALGDDAKADNRIMEAVVVVALIGVRPASSPSCCCRPAGVLGGARRSPAWSPPAIVALDSDSSAADVIGAGA